MFQARLNFIKNYVNYLYEWKYTITIWMNGIFLPERFNFRPKISKTVLFEKKKMQIGARPDFALHICMTFENEIVLGG